MGNIPRPAIYLGQTLQGRVGALDAPRPHTHLLPSPSYLYPDGKNHNPDLTELCRMEPHQHIHVSEVRPRPPPRPTCPLHTLHHGSGILSHESGPRLPEAFRFCAGLVAM